MIDRRLRIIIAIIEVMLLIVSHVHSQIMIFVSWLLIQRRTRSRNGIRIREVVAIVGLSLHVKKVLISMHLWMHLKMLAPLNTCLFFIEL